MSGLRPGTTMYRIKQLEHAVRELRQEVGELRGQELADDVVEVSLHGPAVDVAMIAGLLAGAGCIEVTDRCEPDPGAYGPGCHVVLGVRVRPAAGKDGPR